jgi:hypothetical protein
VIDEVQLRQDIQDHRRAAKMKPKKYDGIPFRNITPEQREAERVEAERLYETDRMLFNLKLAANRELEAEKRRATVDAA